MTEKIAVDNDEISLLDLLQTVAENIRLLIFGPLMVGLTALGISFLIPPTFTASTQFLPPQQQQSAAASMLQSLGALGGIAGAATGLKNPNDQFVALLQSRAVENALIDRFQLVERYEVEFKEDARKTLEGHSRISSGKDGLITVSFNDKDPAFAAEVTNAYVQELTGLLGRLAVTEAQQRRLFFEKQLQQTLTKLTVAERALKATGVNGNALKSNPQAALEGVAKLQAAVTAQEVKVASMRGYLTETAPEFKQAMLELSALRSQLSKVAQDEPAINVSNDYVSRYREFKYQENLFEMFSKQYEIAKVDESREGAVIQIVDAAEPPQRKSKPQKALIAIIATLGSGFVMLLFIFIRNAIRNASNDPETAIKLQFIKHNLRFIRK